MIGLRLCIALAAIGLVITFAKACPFCSMQGQTLAEEVSQADLIVLGKMTNAKRDPVDFTQGETELVIDEIVKDHPYLNGLKKLVIPRYIEPPKDGTRFLVFGSIYRNSEEFPAAGIGSTLILANPALAMLDPYRGDPVAPKSTLPKYLAGAMKTRDLNPVDRLKFYFEYLDDADLVIGSDAMTEFGNTEYKHVRELAKDLPRGKVLGWLKDRDTPPSRFGLYGLFIGHCGTKDDAKAIRDLLNDPDRVYSSGLDGMLAAYIMLDKEAGWPYLLDILKNPDKEFPVRYAALKVLRFFWEYRPDVVSQAEVLEGMRHLIRQKDIADLPIEDLRKWQVWDESDFVLQFADEESHNKVPIIRRAILRFALSAPQTNAKVKAYVEKARQDDPDRVRDVEELLQDEKPKKADAGNGSTSTDTDK